MAVEPSIQSDREDRIDEIVFKYMKALEAGQRPDRQEILAGHPDVADDLARFFANQDRLNPFSSPLFPPVPAASSLQERNANPTNAGNAEFSLGPAPSGEPVPSTIAYQPESRERYTIVRHHAGGGIGDVYLAHDSDLGRQVALKELKPKFADLPMYQARFLEEARITGQLEHPGIVPVHELTRRAADQKPFYTMRFIKGRTLSHAIKAYHCKREAGETGPLDLRELLNVFVGVCNAVAYAHSRGVIHRDLKPQNVALGDFGEALVLDWGLAKVLGEKNGEDSLPPVSVEPEAERGETMSGQRIGTIPYMAPEQAEGRIDLMDRRTDVYGLGAILYEILTGEPPFTGPEESVVLDRVKHEPPISARRRVAATPVALEAVCLKALAKKREDRYGSAKELAQEIERFLADEPVVAYPEPFAVRARRWLGKHRTLATATGAAVIVATIGLATATVLLQAANDRERKAKENEAEQRQAAESAQQQTEEARQQAENNLQKALSAGNQMLTRIGEKRLTEVPQMDEVRQKLLEDALEFYQGLVQKGGTDPAVWREIGRAYQRTGHIRQMLGNQKQAENDYGQALQIQRKLVVDSKNKPSYAHDLALTYHALGDLCRAQQGRTLEAERAYLKALEVLKPLADAHQEIPEFKNSLAATQNNLGALFRDTWRIGLAERSLQNALEIRYVLAHDHAVDPEYRNALANSYESLGDLFAVTARRDRAKAEFEKAVAIREQLSSEYKKDPEYQSSLGKSYTKLGKAYEDAGQLAQADGPYEKGFRISRQLAKDHPSVLDFQTDLAISHRYLGRLYFFTNRKVEADSHFQESADIFDRLMGEYPKQVRIALDFANNANVMGVFLRESGDPHGALQALPLFARSIPILRGILEEEPGHTEARERLTSTYMDRAETFVRLGRKDEAIKDWDRGIELGEGQTSPHVRMYWAVASAHRGAHAQATAEVEALLARGVRPENALYNFACTYSLSSAAVLNDASLRSRYSARSVEILEKARGEGSLKPYVDYLKTDTDLDPLRERDDFKKLILQLEQDAKPAPMGE